MGRFLLGAFLVLFGVAWFLQASTDVEVPWRVLLPAALVLVGIALSWGARSGAGQGGLIALGIALTVVLSIGTALDVSLAGGVGEQTERPRTLDQVGRRYELAIGRMTVDLTALQTREAGAPIDVRARVGIGELILIVPRGDLVEVTARVGAGQTVVFGRDRSGVGIDNVYAPRVPEGAAIAFSLSLSVGLGRVEVRYG